MLHMKYIQILSLFDTLRTGYYEKAQFFGILGAWREGVCSSRCTHTMETLEAVLPYSQKAKNIEYKVYYYNLKGTMRAKKQNSSL